jgi:hypothetical protein
VVDDADRLGLVKEAILGVLVVEVARVQHLHGGRLVDVHVLGPVDDPHPAAPDHLLKDVVAQAGSDEIRTTLFRIVRIRHG